jgi:hypothetical protein
MLVLTAAVAAVEAAAMVVARAHPALLLPSFLPPLAIVSPLPTPFPSSLLLSPSQLGCFAC